MNMPAQKLVCLRDGREVLIRPATPDDADGLVQYMQEGLPEFTDYVFTAIGEFTNTVEQERERIASLDHASGSMRLIAVAGDRVVGSLGCSAPKLRRIAHVGHLGMATRQAYWGTGLGSAMMAYVIAWAITHPVLELLELSVYADNTRAVRLYQKFGFEESGRVPRSTKFAPDVYKDNIHMYRRVDVEMHA